MSKVFSYYFSYCKPHWFSGVVVFPVYLVSLILVNTVKPLLYKETIDIMALGPTQDTAGRVFELFWYLALLLVVAQTFFRIGDYTVTWFQSKVLKIMTDDTYRRIHRHGVGFFEDHFVGSLVTKARRFVRSFETIYDTLLWNIWFSIVICGSILIALAFVSSILALVFLVWIFVYVGITFIFIKYKRPRDLAKAAQDSRVTGFLADTLTNFLNIKMFASRNLEQKRFESVTQEEHRIRLRAWNFANHQTLVQSVLLGFILELGMMYIVVRLWLNGTVTLGTVVLVQSYVVSVFGQLWNLGKGLTRFAEGLSDAQEMIDIFETREDIQDPPQPEKCRISHGVISFSSVFFRYNEKVRIFEDFDFSVQSGEKIGLIGHSGAGKTTIVKLLLRFSDVTDGSVKIDGQDIRAITQDDLRRNIAYVPQEPILFHRTLRENILYGNPEVSEQEMLLASKKAHAHDFISALPEGYDTLVGERGIKLSGGERQRVAIARAMLKDAPILILDEATSALDSISEKHIQSAFSALMKNRTTIVIAHRLSTIQKMDRIVVLDGGKISEEGTHDVLLEKDGTYSSFWKEQAGGFLGS